MNCKMFFRLPLLMCLCAVSAICTTLLSNNVVCAQDADGNAGQDDLDKATEQQLSIEELDDVATVIRLCESALSKGLDKDNTEFAKQLLVNSLWRHASQLSSAIFDVRRPHPSWQYIRGIVLKDVDKINKHDDQFADAYTLGARLQGLPGGDRADGIKRASQAIKLFGDDKKKSSAGLVLRARLHEKKEDQLADLAKAIELDAGNAEAWQTRAALRIVNGEWDKAVGDLELDGPGIGRAGDEANHARVLGIGHVDDRPAPVPQMRDVEIPSPGALEDGELERRAAIDIAVSGDVDVAAPVPTGRKIGHRGFLLGGGAPGPAAAVAGAFPARAARGGTRGRGPAGRAPGRAAAKASRSRAVHADTRMQRFCGATNGMRTKISRAIRLCRTACANAPSSPQSMATKFVADGSATRPLLAASCATVRRACATFLMPDRR